MAKNHTINKNETVTIRLWAEDLPTLLEDVKNFLLKEDAPVALWNVDIAPTSGNCSVLENEWMAVLTHYDVR